MCAKVRVCILLVLFPLLPALAEYRVFTNPDGAKIEAQIVSADSTRATIRLRDGRLFKDVSLDRFSSEDRRYVAEWLKDQKEAVLNADVTIESDFRISFLKGKDDDKNDYGDIDDRVVKFDPQIVIDSLEYEEVFPDVSGTLVVVGKGILSSGQYAILSKQDFSLTVLPRKQNRWTGKSFECRYDPDFGGFEYGGYLIVVRNRAGQIVLVKASKSVWERDPDRLLNAKARTGYNSSFDRERQLYTTFGLPR